MFDFDADDAVAIKPVTMEAKLDSHLIPIDAFQADNFEEFFEERKEALLEKIEEAMGKPVSREEENPSDEG